MRKCTAFLQILHNESVSADLRCNDLSGVLYRKKSIDYPVVSEYDKKSQHMNKFYEGDIYE